MAQKSGGVNSLYVLLLPPMFKGDNSAANLKERNQRSNNGEKRPLSMIMENSHMKGDDDGIENDFDVRVLGDMAYLFQTYPHHP
ncbi:hypothetical protein L1887_10110 [Cichorium endivia]|nr:hypothetical protein L1887_10110 [Cichorium endivia]